MYVPDTKCTTSHNGDASVQVLDVWLLRADNLS
jgi:hypothetical protein